MTFQSQVQRPNHYVTRPQEAQKYSHGSSSLFIDRYHQQLTFCHNVCSFRMQFSGNDTWLQTGVEAFRVVSCSADSADKVLPPELCDHSSVPAFSCAQKQHTALKEHREAKCVIFLNSPNYNIPATVLQGCTYSALKMPVSYKNIYCHCTKP